MELSRELEQLDLAYSEMVKMCGKFDREVCHYNADELLCKLLGKLGFSRTVAEFEKLPKWYA